jgi:hypothetical protein
MAPLILHLGTVCRWAVSVRTGCFNIPALGKHCGIYSMAEGPDVSGERQTPCLCRQSSTTLWIPPRSAFTVPTELQNKSAQLQPLLYKPNVTSQPQLWLIHGSELKKVFGRPPCCYPAFRHKNLNSTCVSFTNTIKWHQRLSKFTNPRNAML